MHEAARLCHLLCLHAHCSTPATLALLALMLFHAARFDARLDQAGCLLLLEEQDRSRWDYGLIKKAMEFLARSAQGETITAYHLEAGIAMYHCKAASFAGHRLAADPAALRPAAPVAARRRSTC